MGRRRIYQHHNVPGTVALMVHAMIQDYPRRKTALDHHMPREDVACELNRINRVIEDAVNSYEPCLSNIILNDIICCRGYGSSPASEIASKNLYYNLKNKIIEEIAIHCNLL